MTRKASSHKPETIIVVDANVLRVVCPADFFLAYATGLVFWFARNIRTVL